VTPEAGGAGAGARVNLRGREGNSLPENARVGSARALGNGRRRLPASTPCPRKTLPAPFYANASVTY
jgi:hypothetical protein